jgi:predicted small lipoprotein YifL
VSEFHRLFRGLGAVVALAVLLALAGCGRKGPLDAPPAALTDQHPAAGATAAKADAKGAAAKAANKHFPLDFLLN